MPSSIIPLASIACPNVTSNPLFQVRPVIVPSYLLHCLISTKVISYLCIVALPSNCQFPIIRIWDVDSFLVKHQTIFQR